MLIGLGQDLQLVSAMAGATALREPGVFFTDDECAHVAASSTPEATLAGLFSAKEALFKALPEQTGSYWTDIELIHERRGAVTVRLHGALDAAFRANRWQARVSISHSGEYASAVAVIWPAPATASACAPEPGASAMTYEPSTTTMWVRPNDLDSLGHVNNATVLEYLENGRWDWMSRNGIRPGKRVIAVVARIEVDYRRMIATRQVRVETTLEHQPDPDEIAYQVVFRQQVIPIEDNPSLPAVLARVQVGFFDTEAGGLATVNDFFHVPQ